MELRFYGTDFHSLIFTKELVNYTLIRNFGFKEHIFMVPMSSFSADFTVMTLISFTWSG